MIRFGRLNLALVLLLVLPTMAAAQRDSRYTREANKFIGLAMTKQDEAERTKMYQDAMVHLREGMERDGDNAKVWLLAGTVLSALGELQEADAAFKKAQQMHPEYAEEIAGERETAWVEAFNRGIEAMDRQDYAGAIREMENAQLIYNERPEALMNLGALYANEGELDKAEQAFRDAIRATQGSLLEKLDDESKAQWARFRDMATLNIAQMSAGRGVDAFEAGDYARAEAEFRKATEVNTYSRDYWFNVTQSKWAQASELEEKLESAPEAEQASLKQQLIPMYAEVKQLAQKTREMDPLAEVLYILEAQSERRMGEHAGDPERVKQGHDAALKLLQEHDALPIEVAEVVAQAQEGSAVIQGRVKNRRLAAGTQVTLRFTLIGLDGRVLAEQDVTVAAGEPEAETPFEAQAEVAGEIAGWKYVLRG